MKEKNENQFKLTDFDYLTADPKLQMLKAAIPYLPVSQQRAVSLLGKIQELHRAQFIFHGAFPLHTKARYPHTASADYQALCRSKRTGND